MISKRKFYWIVYKYKYYDYRSSSEIMLAGAISEHPLSWIINERKIQQIALQRATLQADDLVYLGPQMAQTSKLDLISWQEISEEEYEFAKQNQLSHDL